jgi:arylsulfatase A-like enzyme
VPWDRRQRVVNNVVGAVDLMPTLLDLLVLPRPGRLMGQSLYPAFCNQPLPHHMAAGKTYDPSPFPSSRRQHKLHKSYALDRQTKIILDHFSGRIEIFDLAADPKEQHNLNGQNLKRDLTMTRLLDRWLHAMREPEAFPRNGLRSIRYRNRPPVDLQAL